MRTRVWLALALASLTQAIACGEVESCKETQTPGCLNSPPRADGTCLFDLVRRGQLCVRPGSELDLCSSCADGALCVPQENRCANFCEQPAVLPGSVSAPESIFCQAFADPSQPGVNPMLSFEEVCVRRCRLDCRRLEQFCPEYKCPEGTCDQPVVQDECLHDCPLTETGAKDLACLTQRCEDIRFGRCESSLECPNGATPDCANWTCTNDCAGGRAGDGFCDDTDPYSSQMPLCDWGSDCADCGARKGTAPAPGYWGEVCKYRQNCSGATGTPVDALSWCVELAGIAGLSRCAPDCSRGQGCPNGFECRQVLLELGGPVRQPIVADGLTSQACFPLLCSGLDAGI